MEEVRALFLQLTKLQDTGARVATQVPQAPRRTQPA